MNKKAKISSLSIQNNPYSYDNQGHMVSHYAESENISQTSMKYRNVNSRRSEVPKRFAKSPQSLKKPNIEQYFKAKLWVNITNREVYVLKDGSIVSQNLQLPGFYYNLEEWRDSNRKKHSEEIKDFFDSCQRHFKTSNSFKFLFSCDGKILHCLHQLPPDGKIVIVGHSPVFKGLIEQEKTEFLLFNSRSPCYKSKSTERGSSILKNIQSQFTIKSNKYKICKKPFNYHSVKLKCIKPNQLKEDYNRKKMNLKLKLGMVSYKIDKTFPTLCSQGLSQLKEKFRFSEAELHNLYGKFKLLVLLSSGVDPNHDFSSGINKATFIDYYSKSQEISFVLGKIFDKFDIDKGGTVSWEEFLTAMDIIWHGDSDSQLDLFFNIYDLNGDGCLSFKEVQELCKLQLQIKKADNLIEDLSYSFASLIFDLVHVDYKSEIPAIKIKELIHSQQDASLIQMFCSFNCLK